MLNIWNDKSTKVRKGEELGVGNLKSYLNHFFEIDGDINIAQFPSGYSNLTYLLQIGKSEYVLRRPPIGANIKSGHDMKREFDILSALKPSYTKVPKPILYCEDNTVLGCPFYLMERVEGVILRAKMPEGMIPSTAEMQGISNSFVDTFVDLHQLNVKDIGLDNFGKPEGYMQRQIEGWTKRYYKSKTDEIPKIEAAAKWLGQNTPKEPKNYSLIHNDFKYDNLILDPQDWTKVNAVLDWEMATIGNPLMDLGTTLGYWVNPNDPDFMKALNLTPTNLRGNLSREEVVHQYSLKSGQEVTNIIFYYVYGLFKIAVIIQQIFYRYKKGFTQDPRFAKLIDGVTLLGEISQMAIAKKRLDGLF
ncbi:phosphotransferase family protein [Arenibacter troitsensis]|uniref:Predicted kinase, aminoglycoside phosphotransferase (APT) family n=1 Tax=Arenibacter troitsensis TaxID=188872 RepID=A0A1X7IDI4_9FLAO|nr:phosphotransferase family protein [Arenibacter troitsensis]SMG12722.1 Predicted kinase, aminoglycoside phosphotransferase (APT) family [Arenibacter troitsensis]